MDLAPLLLSGDRRALAKAITLVESTRPDHRLRARALLDAAVAQAPAKPAVRLGISGAPGAGKSSFIEAFGLFLLERGEKVAVLAVDPSSMSGGGAILGDKTRMELLSRDPRAFIRPSPSAGTLGGVARRTREAMLLCEAAGYTTVLIETVGVGQSEIAVADMTDLMLLLLPPASGDDLQGIKKGIVERADLLLVTKADGALKPAAAQAEADYRHALSYLRPPRPGWQPQVFAISSTEGRGLTEVWDAVQATLRRFDLEAWRAGQARHWLWDELQHGMAERLRRLPAFAEAERAVIAGTRAPGAAAEELLQRLWS